LILDVGAMSTDVGAFGGWGTPPVQNDWQIAWVFAWLDFDCFLLRLSTFTYIQLCFL